MSIVHTSKEGWIISHLEYLDDIYRSVQNDHGLCALSFNKMLFEINSQYLRQNQITSSHREKTVLSTSKTNKRKLSNDLPHNESNEISYVKEAFHEMLLCAKKEGLFNKSIISDNNEAARSESRKFYMDTFNHRLENFHGSNNTNMTITSEMQQELFVFPQNSSFYCYDVRDIDKKMELNNQFDLILLDPPWWNKSIRRKKGKYIEASYKMMYNEELVKIPIGKLLRPNGVVAVWCTNAPTHLDSIFKDMFPAWGIVHTAKWYWIKVTQAGDTICNFNPLPGKRPYELLILGLTSKSAKIHIPTGKLIVSIPSALHSHKPPITEILKNYLPKEPKCLEIFARYLLPGWTSWGLEVLKFQHVSLYTVTNKEDDRGNHCANTKKEVCSRKLHVSERT